VRTLVPLGLGLWLVAAPAGAVTPAKIADPRPKSAVVDQTGTLAAGDVAAIDTMAERARAGGEILVVVIDSVSEAVPRKFTTELFNRWGLDGKARNRGVMLLVALKERKAEIVVGDGYPGSVTTVTDRIMSQVVAARFRAALPREAIVEGARAIVDQVVLAGQAAGPSAPPRPAAAAVNRSTSTVPPQVSLHRGPPSGEGLFDRMTNGAVEHPLPAGGAIGGVVAAGTLLRRYLRNRPRRCKACGTVMTRLDESADDAHLAGAEKIEERVGSVDYDVWVCRCGQTQKVRYGSLLTSYRTCKGCQAKTLKVNTTTLVSATTSSEGRARVDERCANCSYTNTYERSIPRVRESSHRGSSSGRGSSGSW
jgi:uncharacterized protein